jgi:hypothetical protein
MVVRLYDQLLPLRVLLLLCNPRKSLSRAFTARIDFKSCVILRGIHCQMAIWRPISTTASDGSRK